MRFLDLIKIILLSVEVFRNDCMPMLIGSLPTILQKAFQTPTPTTNISDEERALLDVNRFLCQLLHSCLDLLGPSFAFK